MKGQYQFIMLNVHSELSKRDNLRKQSTNGQLRSPSVNSTPLDPTDWLITSLKFLLKCGGYSKSESMSNSANIATRYCNP